MYCTVDNTMSFFVYCLKTVLAEPNFFEARHFLKTASVLTMHRAKMLFTFGAKRPLVIFQIVNLHLTAVLFTSITRNEFRKAFFAFEVLVFAFGRQFFFQAVSTVINIHLIGKKRWSVVVIRLWIYSLKKVDHVRRAHVSPSV